MEATILPLSTCFISPFDINGRTPPNNISPPVLFLCYSQLAFLLKIMLINLEQKLLLVSVKDTQKYSFGEDW